LFSQGEYRDDYNHLGVRFTEPILLEDLKNDENYTVSDQSGRIIEIIGIYVDEDAIGYYGKNREDTASAVIGLKFNKLNWGYEYKVEIDEVHDTAGNLINQSKNIIYWSFDSERELLKPTDIFIIDKYAIKPLAIINAVGKISETANPPKNVFDNNTNTRWSATPTPQPITVELNRDGLIKEVSVAWYYWNQGRIYTYDIAVSVGGVLWTQVATGVKSLTTNMWKINTFTPIYARYIRVTILSQNQGQWASVLEIQVKE
jgi:hypothetical protein